MYFLKKLKTLKSKTIKNLKLHLKASFSWKSKLWRLIYFHYRNEIIAISHLKLVNCKKYFTKEKKQEQKKPVDLKRNWHLWQMTEIKRKVNFRISDLKEKCRDLRHYQPIIFHVDVVKNSQSSKNIFNFIHRSTKNVMLFFLLKINI